MSINNAPGNKTTVAIVSMAVAAMGISGGCHDTQGSAHTSAMAGPAPAATTLSFCEKLDSIVNEAGRDYVNITGALDSTTDGNKYYRSGITLYGNGHVLRNTEFGYFYMETVLAKGDSLQATRILKETGDRLGKCLATWKKTSDWQVMQWDKGKYSVIIANEEDHNDHYRNVSIIITTCDEMKL